MQTEIIELTDLARRRRPTFGEFLVTHRILDRFQLLRALQLKDRMPRARLGQCAVALGYVPRASIERAHAAFVRVSAQDLETMVTEAFHRVPEIEVIHA